MHTQVSKRYTGEDLYEALASQKSTHCALIMTFHEKMLIFQLFKKELWKRTLGRKGGSRRWYEYKNKICTSVSLTQMNAFRRTKALPHSVTTLLLALLWKVSLFIVSSLKMYNVQVKDADGCL